MRYFCVSNTTNKIHCKIHLDYMFDNNNKHILHKIYTYAPCCWPVCVIMPGMWY